MKHLTNSGKSGWISADPECRSMRQRLLTSLSRGLGPGAGWVQRHVAQCPRCQKRLSAWGKVELALSVVRSQSHRLDLLSRANSHAVKMLKHSLREAPQAQSLENIRPEPSILERSARYRHRLANVAACLAILVLTRSGLFASLSRATTRGETFMRQYYAAQGGEDIAEELFGS